MLYRFCDIPQVSIAVVSMSICFVLSLSSPIQDATENDKRLCPEGWLRYEKFCVAKGIGSSDRAVAIYCERFGGIGIKGLCIIRAQTGDSTSDQQSADTLGHESDIDHQQRTDNLLLNWSLLGDKARGDASDEDNVDEDNKVAQLTQSLLDQDMPEDTGACPRGWTHYGTLCVYKPWSVQERCHSMNAIEFNGLCLKHADTSFVARYKDGPLLQKVKRICCCASVRGKPNNYGC
ncbi:uncharacterized protein LOC106066570 [Biomphalaria glabrata]|uniref:Uncharacterized protein LOC106066570 n=1 Tax=Biomphalaria glabrata TaxID=6526 RepID=A0A9W3B644_BIOGL|nr:uncharacterized protein LOC106066570 [Biomphalaria glabrata]